MGDQGIHSEATEPVREVSASYCVIAYPGKDLPQQYEGLIYAKWLRSLRFGNDYFKLIDSEVYYDKYSLYIGQILRHPDCVVRLAVLSDEPDVALGFSVIRANILDYVHVLRIRTKTESGYEIADYRRKGIGTSLVPTNVTTFTHITKTALAIWGNKHTHLKFNPFA